MEEAFNQLVDSLRKLGILIGEGLNWFAVNFKHAWTVLHGHDVLHQIIAAIAVIALAAFVLCLLWVIIQAVIVSVRPIAYMIVAGLTAFLFLTILSYM